MSPQTLRSRAPAPFRVRLPATSANLGPGFDALGLALSIYLTVEAQQSELPTVVATGRDAELCGSTSNNLILMTYTEILGDQGLAAPNLALRIHNEIPIGMGCGSSAAALLAGVFLAVHFGELRWSPQQILDEACRREGHPDNVAACFYGGMTASLMNKTESVEPESSVKAATCGRDLKWSLLLALPHVGLSTTTARALLPDTYIRHDAITNIQATSLLVSAFALDQPELLRFAMHDRLHQPFRMAACPLLPLLLPLVGQLGIWGAALSGAGPSVLLIADPKAPIEPLHETLMARGGNYVAEILMVRVGEAAVASEASR